MQQLLIDVGNTRLKWLMFDGGEIAKDIVSSAVAHKQNFQLAMQQSCNEVDKPDEIWVSNVAGLDAEQSIALYSKAKWNMGVNFVEVKRKTEGVEVGYKDLNELGVDRWLAILGSRELIKKGAVIVVNLGTAITVDYLNDQNYFLGGAILPGFDLSLRALNQTARINNSSWQQNVNKLVGDSTLDCASIGVTAACIGGVERLIDAIKQQQPDCKVIISGGAASVFMDASKLEYEYDANLVIRGLMRISRS